MCRWIGSWSKIACSPRARVARCAAEAREWLAASGLHGKDSEWLHEWCGTLGSRGSRAWCSVVDAYV
jgi:hypothetical protein